MTEADLFQQYAQEAIRWSSLKSASTDERRALVNLAVAENVRLSFQTGLVLSAPC